MTGLFSHRTGVVYLEFCRVVVSDEQLSFIRAERGRDIYWAVPYANLCVLLLGPGTSLTQRAAFKLAEHGVSYGFVGGGGSPLFHAAVSEYRPTEYCQAWVTRWQAPDWRLATALLFARLRVEHVRRSYPKLFADWTMANRACDVFSEALDSGAIQSVAQLMGHEAVFAKGMYAQQRGSAGAANFRREPQAEDEFNKRIDAGNYLAYGLAAAVLWALGIPHAFPVTHGFSRRGALVFDVADIIKDAVLLPLAFVSVAAGEGAAEHRARCVVALDKQRCLSSLFEAIKLAIR